MNWLILGNNIYRNLRVVFGYLNQIFIPVAAQQVIVRTPTLSLESVTKGLSLKRISADFRLFNFDLPRLKV